jgi:hypothetical protein
MQEEVQKWLMEEHVGYRTSLSEGRTGGQAQVRMSMWGAGGDGLHRVIKKSSLGTE